MRYMLKMTSVGLILLPFLSFSEDSCHPAFDASLPQFIIGYGSLMNTKSKNRTDPKAGESIPIELQGFKRGFFTQGSTLRFPSTALGVIQQMGSRFDAVTFQLDSASDILRYDDREISYCRQEVKITLMQSLGSSALPTGQYWIYVQKNNTVSPATKQIPMTLSYVDEFLTGCLEIGEKYHLNNFAKDCITSTSDWSKYWVNDRIFPRRPRANQPNANIIDQLLMDLVPNQFGQIQIE